jgi:serine/threonine protein kinase
LKSTLPLIDPFCNPLSKRLEAVVSNAAWAIGSDIAGFRLTREFGRDAYGDMYLADDESGQPVVVRSMDPHLAMDRSKLMDFYQQAKLGMAVDHPHILKVLQVDQAEGRHFAVTQYRSLPSLKYLLHDGFPDRRRFEEHEAVRIVYLLSKVLEDLHEHPGYPMVHRGLAPANVLIAANGQPILSGMQWGSPMRPPLPYPTQGMTAELFVHMAPEQILERSLADPLADVYSLGALFYTLVTGKYPFKGKSHQEILRMKKNHHFRSPETLVPTLSRSVVQIIRDCLRADPDRRPGSMKRLREFLDCGNRVIGGYRLKSYLGSGNSGDVYQAISPRGHQVAIKLLSPKLGTDEVRLQRFYRGAKIAIQTSHPNLLEGYEVNSDNGQHFLVTELVQGDNLAWLVQKHGPVPEAHALQMAVEAASALHAIHQLNYVHRDVKPSNLLLGRDGHIKLADLGFAKFQDSAANLHDLTRAGRALGTCQYIPPEQFSNAKEVDARADLYSLGVTLFVLLTGKMPFNPASPLEMLMDKAINRFPTARQLNPNVSDATSRLVSWMMQADPNHRPLSAESFIAAARECLSRLRTTVQEVAPRNATARIDERVIIDDRTGSPSGDTTLQKPSSPRKRRRRLAHRTVMAMGMVFALLFSAFLIANVWEALFQEVKPPLSRSASM